MNSLGSNHLKTDNRCTKDPLTQNQATLRPEIDQRKRTSEQVAPNETSNKRNLKQIISFYQGAGDIQKKQTSKVTDIVNKINNKEQPVILNKTDNQKQVHCIIKRKDQEQQATSPVSQTSRILNEIGNKNQIAPILSRRRKKRDSSDLNRPSSLDLNPLIKTNSEVIFLKSFHEENQTLNQSNISVKVGSFDEMEQNLNLSSAEQDNQFMHKSKFDKIRNLYNELAASNLPYDYRLSGIFEILEISKEDLNELKEVNIQKFPLENQIVFDEKGNIQYASFTQLILALTSVATTNVNFQDDFLISFPSFAEPKKLLVALFIRYFINIDCENANIRNSNVLKLMKGRIIRILSKWMSSSPHHFTEKMKKSFDIFLSLLEEDPDIGIKKQIIEKAVQRLLFGETKNIIQRTEKTPPLILPDADDTQWTILDIHPKELARQITILHSHYYRSLKPSEVLTIIWGKEKCGDDNNFKKLIDHFNNFSSLATTTVLYPDTPQQRGKIYCFWIDVAKYCYKLHNFHAMFAVICGLSHPSISRLTETINCAFKLNTKRKAKFQEMNNICDISNDYENYRKIFPKIPQPCVPFFGCFQKDLIYIQESYQNVVNGLINFTKRVECVKVIRKISDYQSGQYFFKSSPAIQKILVKNTSEIDMITLMTISINKEPKK